MSALVVGFGVGHRAGRGQAWLAGQAMRASASAVLNLAEALGREGADRVWGLRIARGSALELDAAVPLVLHRGACQEVERNGAKPLNECMVALLKGAHPRPRPSVRLHCSRFDSPSMYRAQCALLRALRMQEWSLPGEWSPRCRV